MGKERMTIFSQDQGLGKFALCALVLPDKSLLFAPWAVRVPLSVFLTLSSLPFVWSGFNIPQWKRLLFCL